MNTLTVTSHSLPVCGWHSDNPWPALPIKPPKPHAPWVFDERLLPDDSKYYGTGLVRDILPYAMQDGYTRHRNVRPMKTFVLENNRLRAMFMPGVGGRLWSLFDKRAGRELLYENHVLQFARLAIRNAWCSGGIEWNCGFTGHAPTTATDVFAAEVKAEGGQPVLRIYEWERVKQVAFQADFFFLDDDSDFLFAAIRILNPGPEDSSTYWWSNVAFPLDPQTRVIVPTDEGLLTASGLKLVTHWNLDGVDGSYPVRVKNAVDFFYYLPKGIRPWEAAIQADGKGLLCTSTRTMRGRKLFLWGQGNGSRHWPDFLAAEENRPYIEIQSGLARTQTECVPLPAGQEYFWVEAFGPIEADPALVHAADYGTARAAVAADVERRLNDKALETVAACARKTADRIPEKLLHVGSGWGALENRRRIQDGLPSLPPSMPFPDDSMNPLQAPWLQLLDGEQPDDTAVRLPSWQCAPAWRNHLEKLPVSPWKLLQQAINLMHDGDNEAALALLNANKALLDLLPAAEKARFLYLEAVAQSYLNHVAQAAELWLGLLAQCRDDIRMFALSAKFLIANGFAERFLQLLPDDSSDSTNRIKELRIRALVALDRCQEAEHVFDEPFEISDQQEADVSLSELWLTCKTKRLAASQKVAWTEQFHLDNRQAFTQEIPYWLDFRMNDAPPKKE